MPSPLDVAAVQSALVDLTTVAIRDLTRLWRTIEDRDRVAVRDVLVAAAPELVLPYTESASMISATWYEQLAPESPLQVATAPPPDRATLEASARWAAGSMWTDSAATPLALLAGSTQRRIFNASRDTVVLNTRREKGARWARYASSTACAFCRMLAIGGPRYTSARSAGKGQRFHDNCHCMAVPVRPGDTWQPPDYVAQWEDQYRLAAKETDGSTNAVLAHMRGQDARNGASKVGPTPARPRRKPTAPGGGGPRDPGGSGGITTGAQPPHGPDPKWLADSKAHVNGLTGRYRRSVEEYTGSGHEQINGYLRRTNAKPDARLDARIKDIDAVLAKSPLPTTTELTRTIDVDAFGLRRGEDLVKVAGVHRTEDGFMSTTRFRDGGETKGYKVPVRLRVIAPAGTPAAAIEDISAVPRQGEVLLGRGLGYILTEPAYDEELGMWRATMIIKKGATK